MTAEHPILPACPIFSALDPPGRRRLSELLEPDSSGVGAVIVEEGARTGDLWILVQGRCEVAKAAAVGTQVLAEIGPGAVFGEMSFFSRATHAASVRCVTPVDALKLSSEKFVELERTNPAIAYGLTRAVVAVLSERLRTMDEWTTRLLTQTAPDRRAEWSEFRGKLYNNWGF